MYIARFKDGKKHFSVLCPFRAVGTIDEATFNKYKHTGKVQANQYLKTLVVEQYEDYTKIRGEYKRARDASN